MKVMREWRGSRSCPDASRLGMKTMVHGELVAVCPCAFSEAFAEGMLRHIIEGGLRVDEVDWVMHMRILDSMFADSA